MITIKQNRKKAAGLLLIILIISLVGLVFGQTCSGPSCGSGGGSSQAPGPAYYNPDNPTEQWSSTQKTNPEGTQWLPVTNEIAQQNYNQFLQAMNEQNIIPNDVRIETLNSKKFNAKFSSDSNLYGWKVTENNELIDPKNPKLKSNLNDFEEGTKITTSPNILRLELSNGVRWDIQTGTGKILKASPLSAKPSVPSCPTCRSYPKVPQGLGGGPGQGQAGGGQEFQQVLQLLSQFAQQIAQQMKSNGQGQTSVEQSGGGIKATLAREAALALEDGKGNPKLLVSQNDKNKEAEINTKGKNEVDIKNANVIVPEQLAAKVSDETTLVLNGIDGDDPNNPSKTHKGLEIKNLLAGIGITQSNKQTTTAIILPLSLKSTKILKTIPQTTSITAYFITGKATIETNNKITGNAIGLGGQSIELLTHDIEINGHDIDSYALKTFNELKAGGQDLKFYSGESLLEFNNQQTLFNRLPKKIPYGIKKITNKLDQNNKFNLKHYTNRLGELTEAEDENKRISVGDITTKHPTKNLIIAEVRREMWGGE